METKDILIIDDDKDLTKSLKVLLEGNNYNVDTANDAETGMEMFKRHNPDILLLDVMMATDLEGHRIAHTIKSDSGNKDLPILVITGMMDTMGVNIRDAFEEMDNLPSVYLLDKPFETEELLSRIRQLTKGTTDE